MARQKFYAVRNGHTPGIYTTWTDCKAQVNNFSHAEYKSFATESDAKAYLNHTTAAAPITMPARAIAYVDGSFDGHNYGSGAVILLDGTEIKLTNTGANPDMAVMHNVAGEIEAARMAIKYCLDHNIPSLEIHHDYTGIAAWPNGAWKTNKPWTRDYAAYVQSARSIMQIEFIKVKGHSGDKYNNMADALARAAIGLA